MIRKKNLLSLLWLKFKDYNRYKQYKWELKNYTEKEALNFFTGKNRIDTQEKIIDIAQKNKQVNISHGGNIGDIVYSLPTIKKIQALTQVPVHLYLRLNQPLGLSGFISHPLGKVRLDKPISEMLIPLLNAQNYIHNCEVYTDQKIDLDFDFFRSRIVSLTNSNLARWCSYIVGVTPELWKPWLDAQPNYNYKNQIILARSERYCNPTIDYSFLKKYDNTVFIGIKSEYEKMKKSIPNLEWHPLKDFLELAEMIAGCKVFIGNQSFPYAVAEGLKVPRILEAYYHVANVIPEGENAHDFYFQNHFESLVAELAS